MRVITDIVIREFPDQAAWEYVYYEAIPYTEYSTSQGVLKDQRMPTEEVRRIFRKAVRINRRVVNPDTGEVEDVVDLLMSSTKEVAEILQLSYDDLAQKDEDIKTLENSNRILSQRVLMYKRASFWQRFLFLFRRGELF